MTSIDPGRHHGGNRMSNLSQYDESKHARRKDGKFDTSLNLAVTTEATA